MKALFFQATPLLRIFSMRTPIMFVLLSLAKPSYANDQFPNELLEMSIDSLMSVEVSTASTYSQKLKDAPSSVHVLTAADIKSFGYRTLADVLASMPGLYITNDRSYSYIGVRGFSRPGDFSTRVLILIDGMRANDNIYSQGYIGSESMIDIDLIEKVEFAAGPGASIYGDNAFFGVVNIFTKQASEMLGATATAELGSYQSYRGGIRYGAKLANGASVVLSASKLESEGADWYYPEYAATAKDMDGEQNHKLFSKFNYEGLALEFGYINRRKSSPTAPFLTVFNDDRFEVKDRQLFASATYNAQLSDSLEMRYHYNYSQFDYDATYPYPNSVNIDNTTGKRHIADIRATSTAFSNHKLVAGFEYILDSSLELRNFDVDPYVEYLNNERRAHKFGLYLQDEYRISDQWALNAGVRYDYYQLFGSTVNPRATLIYQPSEQNNFKFIYGRAFRAPNTYETFYGSISSGASQKGNMSLDPEVINTFELAWDYIWSQSWRSHVGLFGYDVHQLIGQITDPNDGLLVYVNENNVNVKGIELGLDGSWGNGLKLKSNVSYQNAREEDTKDWLINSPRVLANLQLSKPLYQGWQLGTQLHYTSKRLTKGGHNPSYTVIDANVYRNDVLPGLDVALGVYNILDKDYTDPADISNLQDTIQQNGRMFRLKADYRF